MSDCGKVSLEDAKAVFAAQSAGCGAYRDYTVGSKTSVVGRVVVERTCKDTQASDAPSACEGTDFVGCFAKYPNLFPSPFIHCESNHDVPESVECPTNGCQYVPRIDPCSLEDDEGGGSDPYDYKVGCVDGKCDKLVWDEYYHVPCCLGVIDSASETASIS